jgi:CheY-like chemotaxis protein
MFADRLSSLPSYATAERNRTLKVPRHPLVLVIDDDPDTRILLDTWLSSEGFQVTQAADGAAALKLMETRHFDLLLTDLRLPPPMGGAELVKRAREVHPELRSLFMSGTQPPTWGNPDVDDFISKPFKRGQLIGCVWEVLCRHIVR